jgi:D-arabinose 1-dehydrogenase-like Zn-dependent alcohol dehydrogenase
VDGGHAELMVVDAGSIERLPAGMDPIQAAPVFCAGFTVYSGIFDAELRPGERCAVIGIGGLGHMAVQYAAALGAEVIAVTHSHDKRLMLRDLGAAHVLLTDSAGAGEELRRLGGVDVILNTANVIDRDLIRGLRTYGRISLMGASTQVLQCTPTQMLFGKFRIMGSSQGPRHRLREVLEFHSRSRARTIVETYRLDEATDAYARVASGAARYRAVLVP